MSEKINSERAYFSFRYALPGYTFLILILLINKDIIFNQMKNLPIESPDVVTLFGIVFAFISLLGGSAIGFIVSQPWYFFDNLFIKRYLLLKIRPSIRKLRNIVGSNEPFILRARMAYILTSMIDKEITNLINRLNDILNSMASTISSIFMGLLIGFYFRNLSENIIYSNYDFLIIKISFLIVFIISINVWSVFKIHDSISELMIELNESKIRKSFSRKKEIT